MHGYDFQAHFGVLPRGLCDQKQARHDFILFTILNYKKNLKPQQARQLYHLS